jgi:hypothetical protein
MLSGYLGNSHAILARERLAMTECILQAQALPSAQDESLSFQPDRKD